MITPTGSPGTEPNRPRSSAPRPIALGVRKLAIAGLGTLMLLAASAFSQDDPAPAVPTSGLLRAEPFDRVALIDGTELVVEPLSPRPLPELPRKKASSFIKSKTDPGADAKDEGEQEIAIHTLEAEPRDFLVKRSSIKSVVYFEDMLLAEADDFLGQNRFDRAFEYFLAVGVRNPRWPGLSDRIDRLLRREAETALSASDNARAFRLLDELAAAHPDDRDIRRQLAEVGARRVVELFDRGAYDLGRKAQADYEGRAQGEPALAASRMQFIDRAQQLSDRAMTVQGADRVEILHEARRVWPELPGLRDRYLEAFRAAPVLNVAVSDPPRSISPWGASATAQRVAPLWATPILAEPTDAAMGGPRPDQLAENVAREELGSRLVVRLAADRRWTPGGRTVDSTDLLRTLVARANPLHPSYRARWAALLRDAERVDDRTVSIRLTRAVVEPAHWLLDPVAPAEVSDDGRVETAEGPAWSATGLYSARDLSPEQATFDRTGDATIHRINEYRFPTDAAALEALRRADVDMVERVPPDRVASLGQSPGIRVNAYEGRALHWIALDGRNPALRNRTLRRALSFAIDRAAILSSAVLKRPLAGTESVSDGPFPVDSPANAPAVAPLEYDALQARMLVALARKEMEGQPIRLKLLYPGLPVPRAAVARLVAAWREAGIAVEAEERPHGDLEDELAGRARFDLAWRTATPRNPVWDAGPLIAPAYEAAAESETLAQVASPRILELLLQLERASEWPTARALLLQIDRESRDELPTIPLWELVEHHAFRDRLKGPVETPRTLYQGIAGWSIDPE